MVTAELLYSLFRDVVTSSKAGLSFHHDTNKLLDREAGVKWPACFWKLPNEAMNREGQTTIFQDQFTVSMLFVDQTASERDALEMLHAHTRMSVIAKACVRKVCALYVDSSTEFEGVEIDLDLVGSPTISPIWDDDDSMLTGVELRMTLKDNGPAECEDIYFN